MGYVGRVREACKAEKHRLTPSFHSFGITTTSLGLLESHEDASPAGGHPIAYGSQYLWLDTLITK